MDSWQITVKVERKGRVESTLPFSHSPITIGSAVHCDVVLSDPYISGEHARVTVSRGALTLEDLSRNGCFVDGHRVTHMSLGPTGIVSIPPFKLSLTLEAVEQERATLVRGDGLSSQHKTRPMAPVFVDPETEKLDTAVASNVATLRVISAPTPLMGMVFYLNRDVLTIGRSEHAEIRFDRSTVSRMHAEVRRQGDGRWRVADVDSVNGIAINGRRIKQHLLEQGDRLAVGPEIVLEFSPAIKPEELVRN